MLRELELFFNVSFFCILKKVVSFGVFFAKNFFINGLVFHVFDFPS